MKMYYGTTAVAVRKEPLANVMVKHHAEGELPPWVFSVCSQPQNLAKYSPYLTAFATHSPITINDSLEKTR